MSICVRSFPWQRGRPLFLFPGSRKFLRNLNEHRIYHKLCTASAPPLVRSLFVPCGPATVFRRIVAISVNSVKSKIVLISVRKRPFPESREVIFPRCNTRMTLCVRLPVGLTLQCKNFRSRTDKATSLFHVHAPLSAQAQLTCQTAFHGNHAYILSGPCVLVPFL